MKRKAIIVTGSRHWADEEAIYNILDEVNPLVLIHGDADGADDIADRWAAREKCLVSIWMYAQWEQHGLKAGPMRNEEMLKVLLALGNCGYEIEVHAFPMKDSKGTYHMMSIAEKAGVPVINHGYKGP